MSWKPLTTEFTVIPAKAGIHRYQRVMDPGSPPRYGRNDGFLGHRAFFSSLLGKLILAESYLSVEPYTLALPRGDEEFRLAVAIAAARSAPFKRTFGDANPGQVLGTLYIS